MEQQGVMPVGSEITVVARAQNTSRHERTINLTMTLFAVYYTGISRTKIRSDIFNFNLCSLKRTSPRCIITTVA